MNAPDTDSLLLELMAGGGRLSIDNEDMPVMLTLTRKGDQKVWGAGSITQALAQACRSLKAKPKEET